MDFDDLITERAPTLKRSRGLDGTHEHHLYEGAVMLAYAMHLFRTCPTKEVRIHPDGEHGKQFDFAGWISRRGFTLITATGRTSYGGIYTDAEGRTLIVNPKSGLGDVVTSFNGDSVIAECKGGVINTRHSGRVSLLDRGLHETVGRLMAKPLGGRQVAVVPYTMRTAELALRLVPRCRQAGIEIALVRSRGEVVDMKSE